MHVTYTQGRLWYLCRQPRIAATLNGVLDAVDMHQMCPCPAEHTEVAWCYRVRVRMSEANKEDVPKPCVSNSMHAVSPTTYSR